MENVLIAGNLNRQIHSYLINNTNLDKPLFSFSQFNYKNKEYVAVWDPISVTIVFGHLIYTFQNHTSIIQHWVKLYPRNK